MSKKNKKNNNKSSSNVKVKVKIKEKQLSWYYYMPILFITAIIPLIVYAKGLQLDGQEMLNWKGGSKHADLFDYYKSIWFIIMSFVSFALLIILKLTNQIKIKKTRYYIPIIIYIIATILSAIMCENSTVAMRGFIGMFQGVWVLIGYMLILICAVNLFNSEREMKWLLLGLSVSGFIVCLIGVGQFFGYDFLSTPFGKNLILPKAYEGSAASLTFKAAKGTIYSTFGNPNFLGSFTALLFPLFFSALLGVKDKKYKLLFGVLSILVFFNWIGCKSRAGYLGLFFSFIIFIILFRKKIKQHIKGLLIFIALLIVLAIGMNKVTDGKILNEISRLNIMKEKERLEKLDQGVKFTDIQIDKFKMTVSTTENTLNIYLNNEGELTFTDEKDNKISHIKNEKTITFEDEKYKPYSLVREEKDPKIVLRAYGRNLTFYIIEEGFRVISTGKQLIIPQLPDTFGFEGKEMFASARGYIWSRSIPILKDTFILGYGPDMYTIKFPQNDIVGKLNFFRDQLLLVDKPHNMYLQIGINTGVISLLAVLALFIMYFIDSFKVYFKRDINSFYEYLGIGAFTAFCGYCISGLFNDHYIAISPLFWIILGLGISINTILKKQSTT